MTIRIKIDTNSINVLTGRELIKGQDPQKVIQLIGVFSLLDILKATPVEVFLVEVVVEKGVGSGSGESTITS